MKSILFSALLSATGQVETPETVRSANGPFDQFVYWIENSYLFQKYISSWSPPLNNASFDAVILLILAVILAWTVYGIVMNILYHKKAKAKQIKIRAEREEYMKFLRENGAAGNPTMTFDEWRAIKDAEGKKLTEEQKVVLDNYNAVKDEVKDTALGKIAGFTETLKARKEDRELDKELDAREKEEAARKKAIAEEEERQRQLQASSQNAEEKTEPETVEQAMMPKPVMTKAEEIKQKYSKELEATELVDIEDDDKVVSIQESSIVKEVEVPELKKIKEETPAVDVKQLLEEKTSEAQKTVTLQESNGGFDSLIGNLRAKRAQEEKAKEIESAALEATQQNLEKLKNDMENAITEDKSVKKAQTVAKEENSALTAAQQKALREREKERLRMQRRKAR